MLELRSSTSPEWTKTVMANFDRFLVDHAACERKASATGMSFVVRYTDRATLLEPLIAFAREELEHFHRVYKILVQRGLTLGRDEKNAYVRQLRGQARTESDLHLMDRLLISGIVEARGCERFGMVAEALPPGELKEFYLDITRSEARHHGLFVRLARTCFSDEAIRPRLGELLDAEAKIVASLPIRATVH